MRIVITNCTTYSGKVRQNQNVSIYININTDSRKEFNNFIIKNRNNNISIFYSNGIHIFRPSITSKVIIVSDRVIVVHSEKTRRKLVNMRNKKLRKLGI